MSNLQSVVLTLALSYALIGALLLMVLVYARLHWSAKAIAVVVTSAFYIASFVGVRGLLGWASVDSLPATFKLLQARIVEPHSLEGDPGSIYLWVETLDEGNRPSGGPGHTAFPTVIGWRKRPTGRQANRRRAPAGRSRRRFRRWRRQRAPGRPGVHYAQHDPGHFGRRSLDGRRPAGSAASR